MSRLDEEHRVKFNKQSDNNKEFIIAYQSINSNDYCYYYY